MCEYQAEHAAEMSANKKYYLCSYFEYFWHTFYIAFGIYSLIFAIIEVLLILPALESILEFASSNLLRGINYILVGLIGLGVAANLGIIGGILVLLAAVILIALDIYSKIARREI
jgi:hypothetical protein